MTDCVFATPTDVEQAYYAAFASIDLTVMERVWLDNDAAICIHPGGGLLQGKRRIMQSWTEIFSGTAIPEVEYRLLNTIAGDDIEVHLIEEAIRPGTDRTADPTRILATNIYLRRSGSWYLAEHHASLPMMRQRQTPEDRRRMH